MKAPNDLKELLKEKGYDASIVIKSVGDKAGLDARRLYVKIGNLSTLNVDGTLLPYPWHFYTSGPYVIIYADYDANDRSNGTYVKLLYKWIKSCVANANES